MIKSKNETENKTRLENVAISVVYCHVQPRAALKLARTRSHSLALACARQNSLHSLECDKDLSSEFGDIGLQDQSMKKPILVSLILLKQPLKALMLEAPTAR